MKLDEALVAYVKKEFQLALGERTAEEIKIQLGSAFPLEQELRAEIRGRDLVTGLPRLSSSPRNRFARLLKSRSKPSLTPSRSRGPHTTRTSSDLMEQGIVIAGGGALLAGMAARLEYETNMPIIVRTTH